VELVYGDRKRIAIDSHGTCRIPFPIAKAKPLAAPSSSTPPSPLPPPSSNTICFPNDDATKQVKHLGRYLVEQVRLKWSCASSTSTHQRRGGVVCLPNLPLTESMVACLTSSSISTKIEINGDLWHGTDLSYDSGKPMTVRVTGENNYSGRVRFGYGVECSYVTWTTATGEDEDEDKGGVTNRKRHALPVSGGKRFASCESGSSVSKSAVVFPYFPGKVLIKVSCSTQGGEAAATTRDEVFPDIFVNLS
jgi:hypothetical protein